MHRVAAGPYAGHRTCRRANAGTGPGSGLAAAPQAQAGTARNAQAAANIEAANGLTPGPATLSLGAVSDRFHANQGQREWEVEMAVPLWLPGQKAAQSAEAASGQAQVVAQQHALRLQLAGELRTAWWAVAAARQTRAQAQQRLDTAQALMANVQRRYQAGELARIDANLAQREVLAAQGALADSDAALLQTEQAFRTLTGTAAPVQLDPEPPLFRTPPTRTIPCGPPPRLPWPRRRHGCGRQTPHAALHPNWPCAWCATAVRPGSRMRTPWESS